jgi:hypothetical protein
VPLALLTAGIIFIIVSVRGTQKELFDTLRSDFTGPNNFLEWGVALFVIGAIGYYKPLKPVSTAFMTLLVIVLFISNKGFFQAFMQQIGATTNPSSQSTNRNSPENPNNLMGNITSLLTKGLSGIGLGAL